MATARGFGWGAFFAGVIVTILVIVIVGAIVVFGGMYPVAASTGDPPGVASLMAATRDHAVENSASGLKPPQLTQADIREGGSHFKGMCVECHGGPGMKPEDFATAMNPDPPDLGKATDDLSVSEVFWIAKNGLKMTGMPAFGKVHDDKTLWKIAAFVKQLPKVSPSEFSSLPKASGEKGEGGGENGGDKD